MKKLLTTSAILLTASVLVACSNNQSATKDGWLGETKNRAN